ncbi:MAG: class I SAM-dependent DNA methyltransferase [Defluviicoccus sp.]|nr:class I SAM-dependent DNA methyltransferase [Defluviicoccus sp.]
MPRGRKPKNRIAQMALALNGQPPPGAASRPRSDRPTAALAANDPAAASQPPARTATSFQELANFIWSVADLLRGPYRPPQYERVMLPMTVLRRFDCLLEPTKKAVIERWNALKDGKVKNIDPILNMVAGGRQDLGFHNHSELDFRRLKGDPDNVGRHLVDYIANFSENVRRIFERFEFEKEIEKLEESNRLYLIVSKFAEIDLHPDRVDNITMGLVFEDLIRRFNEAANETAGDHFTPREVIRLMVNLLLEPDSDVLTTPGKVVTVCDPACGTGGMLSEAQNWIREHNHGVRVLVYGQDYNPRSFSVAASDLLIKGHKDSRIEFGNSFTDDKFAGERFDYLLANPPFGVDWKAEQTFIVREHDTRGYAGRFGPKLPRINDGALLFLLHMISKFEPVLPAEQKNGSRCAIVFNGSPLFTGGAASGESEIRRWIIENDWLEAIVALPEQMFYNTGIGTFVWIVTNRKAKARKGRIQLLDARERWAPMRRSLGDKRRYLTDEAIAEITREHGRLAEGETCKIFDNADFGYRRITVERPLRLRFQITLEAKEAFLDACPEFLDAVQAMEQDLGGEPFDDWNAAWAECQHIARAYDVRWTAANRKLFRQCFTAVDAEAKPVIGRHVAATPVIGPSHLPRQEPPSDLTPAELDAVFGVYLEGSGRKARAVEYEPDPGLRDFENVPLKEDIISYFRREVRPFVADAWIDRETVDEKDGGVGKVGYEINFNRVFFRYQPPRPLAVIDAELKAVENRILTLLKEVTE